MRACVLIPVRLFVTPRTVAYQAPLSMEFSRQEYWGGLPCPSPEDLPDPGIKPGSPVWLNVLIRVPLFSTPWAVVCQSPLFLEFPRQEYWGGLPCSPQGDRPESGIDPASLTSPALAGRFFLSLVPPGKPIYIVFQIPFPYRLLQNMEYNSLLCTVGPYLLSVLCVVVCIC